MTPEQQISELADSTLSPNRQFDGVRFINELLPMVADVHEFRCSYSGERKLRFQIADQPPWEFEVERARSKLRMLCARLSVLCNETGGQDVSIYGGKGWIDAKTMEDSRIAWAREVGGRFVAAEALSDVVQDKPRVVMTAKLPCGKWLVQFKNTMHEQEFIIQAQ